ncbi:MAG: alpha/beta fold hydrolase [bacterium]
MTAKPTSLVHKVLPLSSSMPEPHPVLILLHGRGANEDDLLGLAEYFDPRFFTISVRAPYEFDFSGYTWYDLIQVGSPDKKQFQESYRRLLQLIDDIKLNYPVDPKNIFLFGFSMGAIMSLAVALTKPRLVQGVIAHSGYVPEDAGLEFKQHDALSASILMIHGTFDPVIPVDLARRAEIVLPPLKANYSYREYPIAHHISEESLSDCAAWLAAHLVSMV